MDISKERIKRAAKKIKEEFESTKDHYKPFRKW